MDYSSLLSAQRAFFNTHQTKGITFRKEQLRKLRDVIKNYEERMYDAIALDFGKSQFETFATELSILYLEIDYYLKNLHKLAKPKSIWTNLANLPARSYIYQDPLGCTLIIGAWNYPYQLTLAPVISAIAAGNTCIIKPSELPVHTMELMAEMINTNFAPVYLHVVTGGVPETTALLELRFDKIFFTGSTRVGKIVYKAAAKHLTPVTLELGGKSPVFVTESADIDIAVRRIVWGKFLNAGQTCIAPDYILIHPKIKSVFIEKLKAKLTSVQYVPEADHYLKIINDANFQRLLALIDPSKVIYGGNYDATQRYIAPTVMDDVTWEDSVMQSEIFGPILPILTYTSFEEAIDTVLQKEKPLSAYLFSNNGREKSIFTNHLSFGGGCINDTIMHLANPHLPFGGIGHSGMGNYHGKYGFRAFSHEKSILDRALWGETNIKYPPYNETKKALIKKLL